MKSYLSISLIVATSLLTACTSATSKQAQHLAQLKAQEQLALETYLRGKVLEAQPKVLDQHFPIIPLEQEQVAQAKAEMWALYQRIALEDAPAISQMLSQDPAQSYALTELVGGEQMRYRLLRKGERSGTTSAPLFIHLHGGGIDESAKGKADGQVNQREWEASQTLSSRYKDDDGGLYFVPRMVDDRKGRWYFPPSVQAFKRIVKFAYAGGWADPERIYLMGISEGGYGTHRLALWMPDWFAGFGVMAAAEGVRHAQNLGNVAFRLDMGEHDTAYGRIKNAQAWHKELQSMQEHADSPETFHQWAVNIQEGRGHGINYFLSAPWLAQHKREAQPSTLRYEWHNMIPDYGSEGQMYADAVYNLDFRQLQPNGSTMEMTVYHRGYQDAERPYPAYFVQTEILSGDGVSGKLGLYIDEPLDQPIDVYHNGKLIYHGKPTASRAVMAESLALWGDPKRVYPCKVYIDLR